MAAGVECLVQQSMEKITGTLILDRDADHEKKNCQCGIESLETYDSVRHEGSLSSIVEGLRAMGLTIIVPMKWKSPRPSRDNKNVGKRESTTR